MAEMTSGTARFVVGIDLGTTHCAMASALLEQPRLKSLPIAQLVAPGEVSERELLPSFLYLPTPGEFTEAERSLPWGAEDHVVGSFARARGAKTPNRLVASAKSWICHGGVNRRAAILPWSAPDEEPHVSPYEAQVAYLRHLQRMWSSKYADVPLSEQDVVVTVPASFDEGARLLTREAAAEAGLGEVRLLEEPQAAFYDYLGELDDKPELSAQLRAAQLILVVDVGGGTTDLTLLRVLPDDADSGVAGQSNAERSELPALERIAVGGHLMLGGDNMDAALAMFALHKARMKRPEDASLWSSLVQSARDAKERLLAADAPPEAVISYQGRGSRLVGNTKSIVITRAEAERVLLDGCFPRTGPTEGAQRTARAGLTTLGLPYSSDTAVPRHICSFLRRHVTAAEEAGAEVTGGLPRPDLLLLNGGVFHAAAAVERLMEVLSGWYDGRPPALLEHRSLDTAVALGAVRSGLARHGRGTMISGGTARAYYVGIEHAGRMRALCVAPRNADEGSRVSVRDQLFQLRLNEPVSFPLYAYTGDRLDEAGAMVDVQGDHSESEDQLTALAPLETVLRGRKGEARRDTLAVSIESRLDESGALQLGLVSAELPPRRWTLEFVVRSGAQTRKESGPPPHPEEDDSPPHAQARNAARLIEQTLASSDSAAVKKLRAKLEDTLGARGHWSGATCRVLADALLSVEPARAESEAHELNWLRLLSWTMRPGSGVRGDAARMDQLWQLQPVGCLAPSKQNWGQWWILWRRVAPGLNAERQQELFEQVRPWLWGGKKPAGPVLQGPVEMMRMLAAFERIAAQDKVKVGQLLLERANKLGSYWPLGRVGARVLLSGDQASVVPSSQAEKWLGELLALDWSQAEGVDFAAASIARMTGDPVRDVSPALRQQVQVRLTESEAPASWIDMVERPTDLSQGDVKRVLGDSLPTGLRLG